MISIERRSSPEIDLGGTKVTTIAEAVSVRLPAGVGGLVWSRPVGATVRSGDGPLRWIPIVDPTRRAQWFLLGIAVAAGLVLRAGIGRGRRRRPIARARFRRR